MVSYSPELNPVEHIWEDVREKHFPNLASASLEEVIDRLCEGLTQLEADPQKLRAMTYFPHFRRAEQLLHWQTEGTLPCGLSHDLIPWNAICLNALWYETLMGVFYDPAATIAQITP